MNGEMNEKGKQEHTGCSASDMKVLADLVLLRQQIASVMRRNGEVPFGDIHFARSYWLTQDQSRVDLLDDYLLESEYKGQNLFVLYLDWHKTVYGKTLQS